MIKKRLHFFALFCPLAYSLVGAPSLALAQPEPTLIHKIQFSMPSIVEIHAKGAIMLKGPSSTVLDKNTGRIVQLKKVRAAQFSSQGAGVIIDPAGIIVTNAHVIQNAGKIAVILHDYKTVAAKPLKIIPGQDLAFLKIEPPYPLSRIEIANSQTVKLGDEIITVGNSPVLKKTISAGRITGIGQSSSAFVKSQRALFQVNINIYHGDSGGPLLNERGHLIGIMVAAQMKKDRSSFAIPSEKVLKYYVDIIKNLTNLRK